MATLGLWRGGEGLSLHRPSCAFISDAQMQNVKRWQWLACHPDTEEDTPSLKPQQETEREGHLS